MKYTYSDWVSDHLKANEKIETVTMEQLSFTEEKSAESEEAIPVAASAEEAIEKAAENTEKTAETANTEENDTKDNLEEKETTTYKYRGGYHGKKN